MTADFKQLQKLVAEYAQAGYEHIRVKAGDLEIEVSKSAEEKKTPIATGAQSQQVSVTSPMVGIFHPAAHLKVGLTVESNQELGQIESMKLFNPIKSPVAGTVRRVAVSQEQPVEFQQLLVEIQKEG